MNLVQTNLQIIKNFLDRQTTTANIPYLFCNDKWLQKLQRSNVAKDVNRNDIFKYNSTTSDHLSPVSIKNIPSYQEIL
ncbi:unnamed protein product [Penicillium roqueforti FM164]|uniref:Uncharacterized protein n=1 Tax=Penicillium roqueforti (strain FM164) TaxID=1365484 RepID=W6QIN2_PENRF|nr:unnamed protein product [Penicillium roqueforti FM164]